MDQSVQITIGKCIGIKTEDAVRSAMTQMQVRTRTMAAAVQNTGELHGHVCLHVEVRFILATTNATVFVTVQLQWQHTHCAYHE